PPAEPGGARRLRAADGCARLPRRGLALRRLPVPGDDPAARRTGARVGRPADRVLAVRARPAARRRLEDRARVPACERAPLSRGAVPRPPAPPAAAAGSAQAAAPSRVSRPRRARWRNDPAPPRLTALRPCRARPRVTR